MRIHLQEAAGGDPSSWAGYAVQLIGAGGVGYLLRELVKQVFARANKNDDTATVARGELRQQIEALTDRVDVLTGRLDATTERANALFADNAELRAENRGLRSRYHRLLGWLQTVESLPDLPAYLREPVEGPTARDMMPQPPDQPRRRATDRPEQQP